MVHPKVIEEYEKADYEYNTTAHDEAERIFKRQTEGHEIKKVIIKITRIKFPNNAEYMYYDVRYEGNDHVGNRHDYSTTEGRYQKPIFQHDFDVSTRKIVGKAIERLDWVYEIP